MKFKHARKFAVAVTTAVATALGLADDGFTYNETGVIFLAFMGALGVYAVRNEPQP